MTCNMLSTVNGWNLLAMRHLGTKKNIHVKKLPFEFSAQCPSFIQAKKIGPECRFLRRSGPLILNFKALRPINFKFQLHTIRLMSFFAQIFAVDRWKLSRYLLDLTKHLHIKFPMISKKLLFNDLGLRLHHSYTKLCYKSFISYRFQVIEFEREGMRWKMN
jgi:hypothetical protein